MAESGSGSSAERLGQPKLLRNTEVDESGFGSSAERLGQLKQFQKQRKVLRQQEGIGQHAGRSKGAANRRR